MKQPMPVFIDKADKIIWDNGYDQGMLEATNVVHKHLYNADSDTIEAKMALMWNEIQIRRHGMKFPSDPDKEKIK